MCLFSQQRCSFAVNWLHYHCLRVCTKLLHKACKCVLKLWIHCTMPTKWHFTWVGHHQVLLFVATNIASFFSETPNWCWVTMLPCASATNTSLSWMLLNTHCGPDKNKVDQKSTHKKTQRQENKRCQQSHLDMDTALAICSPTYML